MITTYTNEEYSKSYTELIEIIKYFSKSDLLKIPKEILLKYIKYKDVNYNFSFDPNLDIDQQNVSKLTQILLANLYIDYLANNDEKAYIQSKDKEELEKLEIQKKQKYNIENIFNKRKEKVFDNNLCEIKDLALISDKENIIKKIFNKIKLLFK